MASYSPKLLEKKYNNWVKAQLALLFTKEGIEPFVCNELQQFQLKCLDNICYNNQLLNGSSCSSCCTENVVKCPIDKSCNVGRGKCSYHRKSPTKYLPNGCPNNICHHFKTEIQNVHRYSGPSYKNTDATQWCSNYWEVAKCFMPPDGYKDVASAAETDFNGVLSVIINYKDFQPRITKNLNNKGNIFGQARVIGRNVRHSSSLEVEDTDLQQYFKVLQTLLSDPGFLATDNHAQIAKQKLKDLESDTLIIGKDDTRKALDDVAKAAQDKIRTEIDEQTKQYEMNRLNMIKAKQENLQALETKTAEGVQQMQDKTDASVKTLETVTNEGTKKITEHSNKRKNEDLQALHSKTAEGVQQIQDKTDSSVKTLEKVTAFGAKKVKLDLNQRKEEYLQALDTKTAEGVKHIKDITDEKTKTIKEDLTTHVGETLQKTLNPRIKEDEKEKYLDHRKRLKDELITWYRKNHSTVPLSPLVDDRETPLADFYVMPDIDMLTSFFSEKRETTRVNSLNDLFGSGRKVPQEIYLSADAGFGKTAFTKYLTMLWCQAHLKDENYSCFKEEELSALSRFDFVFLVLLRDSSDVCHVDEMIKQQIIEGLLCSKSMPENFVTEILSHEKCLVILDGLDEWTHPQNSCTRPNKFIPHRYALENCVILTTSRPWKLGSSNIKTSQVDKTIELVQLNDDSVFELEWNALKNMKTSLSEEELEHQANELYDVIEEHNLDDLKAVPLILMYIVCLWCDDKPIEESKCQLYTSIIELLLSRTLKKYPVLETASDPPQYKLPQCFSSHGNCQKYSTLIVALGELACHTLFSDQRENSLVFNRSVAEKHLKSEQLKLCLLSGILTESKVKKFTEEFSKISFSHKTVQEYFTAVYISRQVKKQVEKTIVEKCRSLQDILDNKILLVFISGMNPAIISSISQDLMPVINDDETTCKYRTRTLPEYRKYRKPLQDIQTMLITCMKECQQNKDLKLCLQDFFITEECQQGSYFTQLQHLCHQNKDYIKSIFIENEGICSLKEIISLFALCDLQKIEKLSYEGEIVEEEMISLLLKPLRCLTVSSRKWENNKFVGKVCPLSAVMIKQLEKLQHLECLYIAGFTMSHQVMKTLLKFLTSKTSSKTLFNFLNSKTSMKEIGLHNLNCSDHNTSCEGFNLDLSQHSDLRYLGLYNIPVSQLNINVSSLEECDVGKLYKPGVVSSYLSQLPAANKLQSFRCADLESSSDIETMLQTLPLLVHVKDIRLFGINLGERSLTLSPKMVNIELVVLYKVTMFCSVLHDLINVVNKLPHSVTIVMIGCDIKHETEFEQFKTSIKMSDKLMVTLDGMHQSGMYTFQFKTITSKSTE